MVTHSCTNATAHYLQYLAKEYNLQDYSFTDNSTIIYMKTHQSTYQLRADGKLYTKCLQTWQSAGCVEQQAELTTNDVSGTESDPATCPIHRLWIFVIISPRDNDWACDAGESNIAGSTDVSHCDQVSFMPRQQKVNWLHPVWTKQTLILLIRQFVQLQLNYGTIT